MTATGAHVPQVFEPVESIYPSVSRAIAAVSAEIGAVAKASTGPAKQGGFKYRGIDQIMNAISGPLASHGVVIVPNLTASEQSETGNGWLRTVVTVRYDIYGPAGDHISATVMADGLDNADKGPGKAMSYAYKTMVSQVFCIQTDATQDNEASPTTGAAPHAQYQPSPAVERRNRLFDRIDELTDEQRATLLVWMGEQKLELNDGTKDADVRRIAAQIETDCADCAEPF